jgi:hypothetical protein
MRKQVITARLKNAILGLAVSSALAGIARAQQQPAAPPSGGSAPGGFVTREEYDRIIRDQQELRAELEAMRRERAQEKQAAVPTTAPSHPAASGHASGNNDADVQQSILEIRKDIAGLEQFRPGFDQFLIGGEASFGFSSLRHQASSFAEDVAPVVVWRPVDRVLLAAQVDFSNSTDPVNGSTTNVSLSYADFSYEVNDYLSVGGGLFIVPFGQYQNHFESAWVDKLPDTPLGFGDVGIAPASDVGVFARGALPAGPMKFTYDVYVSNGPQLDVSNDGAAGSLNFADYTALNGSKAVGGRFALIPIPEMEFGYSFQSSEPNPSGFQRVHALLQALDFNYKPLVPAIKGVLDFRAEAALSNVSRATYDPTKALGYGPINFSNNRNGGYVQLSYRPTLVESRVLSRFEVVGRFDWLYAPLAAPGGDRERRTTFGLDYWLAPNAVIEAAYEFDHKKVGTDNSGFLVQFGLGL